MKTKQNSSKKRMTADGPLTVGIDIGDQWSRYCVLSAAGDVVEEGRFRTTAAALAKHLAEADSVRTAIENGTHSIWINEQLRGYGHEVIVANVREPRTHVNAGDGMRRTRLRTRRPCPLYQ